MNLDSFISTIISATASIVGIVGGFLIRIVITLSSEKKTAINKLSQINNDLKNKEAILARVNLKILEKEADMFIREYYREVLQGSDKLKELLDSKEYKRLNQENIKPYLEDLMSAYEEIKIIVDSQGEESSLTGNFSKFARDNSVEIKSNRNNYLLAYNFIYQIEAKNKKEEEDIRIYNPLTVTNIKLYRERLLERRRLENDLFILKSQEKEERKNIEKYESIAGLWSGLLVLTYSSLVGIVIPILYLPYDGRIPGEILRPRLLLLFFSGLLLLFLYLGISMYRLTKKDYDIKS